MESTELTNVVLTGVVVASALVLLVLYLSIRQRNKFLLQQEKIKAIEFEKQKEILTAMIQTQESERRRIAEDLHDSVAGSLSMISFNLSTVVRKTENEVIAQSLMQLDELVDSVRDICYDLYPPYLQKYGIIAAIEQMVTNCRTSDISTAFTSPLKETQISLPIDNKVNLFRIFQEVFTNSIKHGKWTQCDVQILNGGRDLEVIIKHNGSPFKDPEPSAEENTGIGHYSIRRRLNLLNGNIQYQTEGQRQLVHLQIPNVHGDN